MNFKLSDYGEKSLIPSPVNKLTDSFANDFREGIDINLGVGYVNDETIPALLLGECYQNVISDNLKYRNTLNYGGAEGSPNLLTSIKQFYKNHKIGGFIDRTVEDNQLIIGANGATSILEGIAHVLPKGIVVTSDPSYYIYTETLTRVGFTVKSVPEDADGINIEGFECLLNEINPTQLSFIYLVTVNNPSCTILSNFKRKRVVKLVDEFCMKHSVLIPVIFDQAYELIVYNDFKPESMLKYNRLGNIYEIGTLSKVLAPALRIGYMWGKQSNFTNALIQKISDVGFSASLINQEMASNFLDNYMSEQLELVREGYKVKSKAILNSINELLGDFLLRVDGGGAGFYFYLTFKEVETCEGSWFYAFLSRKTGVNYIDADEYGNLKPRLVYIPGNICVNPNGQLVHLGRKQLRLSFGFESTETILKAILLIRDACEYSKANGK